MNGLAPFRTFLAVAAALLLAGTLACGGGGASGPPPPPPVISAFYPLQATVSYGSGTSLRALFTGGTGTIDQGIGAVTAGVDAATGLLTASTSYRLTVSGPGGTATAVAQVTVVAKPSITAFTNDGPVDAGNPAHLSAAFTGGNGLVTPGSLPIASGAPLTLATMAATTTYTLTVTNAAGDSATATTTVVVAAGTASLELTVAGLPAGAGSAVGINGPGGYYHALPATTTLTGLSAGTYTIVPGGVASGGQMYQASGTQVLALADGAGASATVTYAPVPLLVLQIPDSGGSGATVPLALVPVPAGTFQMGAYDGEQDAQAFETPQHAVTLGRGFYMAQVPTTQAQWKAVMGSNPSVFCTSNGGAATDDFTRPVENLSWSQITAAATGFLDKLNAATASARPSGYAFRLPTEAEWEYACRAGTTTRFYWGDDPGATVIDRYAWWKGDSSGLTHPVGSLGAASANPWGLSDMAGDVFEWCSDWYGTYAAGAQTDPQGPATGTYRVVRGGSWYHDAIYGRSANRSYSGPDDKFSSIGFRVVLAPAP